jgi:hypothetical protein
MTLAGGDPQQCRPVPPHTGNRGTGLQQQPDNIRTTTARRFDKATPTVPAYQHVRVSARGQLLLDSGHIAADDRHTSDCPPSPTGL